MSWPFSSPRTMAGYAGGGGDFCDSAGAGPGSPINGPARFQYRSQQFAVDPVAVAASQRVDSAGSKRSLAELQQQQAAFLRSVKQRVPVPHHRQQYYQQAFPISPLSPVSSDISTASSISSVRAAGGYFPPPLVPRMRPGNIVGPPCKVSFSVATASFRAGPEREVPDPDKKIRSQLQELEKQLLDDDEEDPGAGPEVDDGSAASALTNSEWSETMQSILSPPPPPPAQTMAGTAAQLSSSPTCSSSSSSSSCTTASSSSNQQLVEAATAISEGLIDQAAAILVNLKQASSPRAGNPDQRLVAYLVSGLHSRIAPSESDDTVAELFSGDHLAATQILYEASPCFKFGFTAASLAILEATQNHPKLHILDFNIGQGRHAADLLEALAERRRPAVRITAVTAPSDSLRAVADRLTKIATRLGLTLQFGSVATNPQGLLDTNDLAARGPDEALAVNFAFNLHRLPDESVSTANPRDELLRQVRALGPVVVVLAEQDTSANTAPFLPRFGEARAHYGALFDSLDATLARDGAKRWRVEECLGRKAANAVAREGADRVERCEVSGKWRARMGMAGFQPSPLPPQICDSVRAELGSANPGFFAQEDAGGLGLGLGWNGRILTFISAWR